MTKKNTVTSAQKLLAELEYRVNQQDKVIADDITFLRNELERLKTENNQLRTNNKGMATELSNIKKQEAAKLSRKLYNSQVFVPAEYPWSEASTVMWVSQAGEYIRISDMPSPYIKNCLNAIKNRYGMGWENHISVRSMVRELVERGDL